MYEIRQTEQFKVWLRDLKDDKAARLIARRLDQIQFGHFGDYKYVGDGVSEMRIHYGAGYRLYYTKHKGRIIILLCAGQKRTQTRDIKRAKLLLKEGL